MIWFTKHAQEKFLILNQHGIKITKQQIIETLNKPKLIDKSRLPLLIAQRDLDDEHVLRVVYKQERAIKTVITFYPGRKKQYD